jgi:hypothetical protein
MNIQKESLIVAMWRFRHELEDAKISESEKIRLLAEFKKWFERSLDYDLASARVLENVLAIPKSMTFREHWKSMGEVNKLFGFKDEGKIEYNKLVEVVDKGFLEGQHENNIVNGLIVDFSNQLGDRMTDAFVDKIRYWVLQEKVKLQNQGKI